MKISKIAFILLIVSFTYTVAQDMPPFEGNKQIEKIEQMENAKLIQVLNLNEETAVRFFTRRKEYREQQMRHLEHRRKLMDSINELLKSDEKENPSVYKEKLDELISIEWDLVKGKGNFYKSLHNLLSIKQMVQLAAFEDKFRREVRETLMKRSRNKQGD
jgi:hypothetical protein